MHLLFRFDQGIMERKSWLVFSSVGALFLLAWLLPNHYLPWVVVYSEFASFSVVVVLGFALLSKGARLFASALAFMALAAIPLVQLGAGLVVFAGDAVMAAVYLAGFAVMLTAGYAAAQDRVMHNAALPVFAGVLVLGAGISVWIALRQWLMLSGSIWVADLPLGGRPFANLAQPNSLATLLCMGLAGVVYLYEKRYLGSFCAGLLALFLIFGVALTQSRTPWVGALCALLWWGWKSRTLAVSRLPLWAFAVWVGVYVLAVLSLHSLGALLYLSSVSLAERAQAMQRLDLWWQLWQAVLKGPLWGYGWNQVSYAQVGVAVDHPVPIVVQHSHNVLLDFMVWNGPALGLLIVLFIAVWLARLGVRASSVESVFALLVVGFVLVHGMLEYPLEYAFFLFPVGLLLGFVEAEQCSPVLCSVPRWLHVGLLIIAIAMLGLAWREYRLIEEDYRQVHFDAMRVGDLEAEGKVADVVLLTQLREFIRFSRAEAREDMSMDELEWMGKVAHRYPDSSSLFRYTLALGLNRQPEAARKQMLVLRSLHGEGRYERARLVLQATQSRHPQLASLLALLPVGRS